ncbi:MAG: methyltransferase, partial [Rhizobiaceae bacterium]
PIEVNEGELALDALGGVPTGGHFFGEAHTLERYSTAFYQPMLSNWQNYEAWQEAGGRDATERATVLWKKALDEYVQPAMDEGIREELQAYVAKRKEEIGGGEP